MSVYATEAIRDPTLMEMKAKEEVAKRRTAHEIENESRKLTPDQRFIKEQAKIELQKEKGIFCSVFRIENLSDPKHQYLVNVNAVQSKFTGVTIFNEAFTLVIVEGGAREITHYQKLLLNRIKWTESAPPRVTESSGPPPPPPDLSLNRCRLVWHGQLKRSKFNKWTRHRTESEQDVKDFLSRHDADLYWVEARQLPESSQF
jgi:U4/U6 small nuclear ribonucleoprotein PRP3